MPTAAAAQQTFPELYGVYLSFSRPRNKEFEEVQQIVNQLLIGTRKVGFDVAENDSYNVRFLYVLIPHLLDYKNNTRVLISRRLRSACEIMSKFAKKLLQVIAQNFASP